MGTTCAACANSAASACESLRPCGESSTTRVPKGYASHSLAPVKLSTAAKIGSGFKTIPSPPPNGLSSTCRCLPAAHSRRSCALTSTNPAACARRIIPYSNAPRKKSGKMVMTSKRIAESRNLKLQQAFRRVYADEFFFDVNENADVFRHRDQVLAPAFAVDHQHLDAASAHHLAHRAEPLAPYGLDATAREFPLVELILFKLDALRLRHGELAADELRRLFGGVVARELEDDALAV